ncbi:MAG: amidohydrolase family protein [Desulfurococcales archaeon]|nr:amidohydrolase family protein [Desulfurococcales archaeon]
MVDIIDFHMHLPPKPRDPRQAAHRLVEDMDSAGVSKGVVIAVEVSRRLFKTNVDKKALIKALRDSGVHAVMSKWGMIRRIIEEPEKVIEDHEYLIVENRRSNHEVLAAAESSGGRLIPVASYNPDESIEDNIGFVERNRRRILGIKVFPTFHFINPGDRRLFPLYQALEDLGLILIVHTGCDPGIWELPPMCREARPRHLEHVAREFPDLDIVIAHLGSYSLLQPGIYFHESIEIGRKYGNIYFDTSAVDSYFIEKAVKKLGSDKLLFGSDHPYMVGLSLRDLVSEIIRLPIDYPDKIRIVRENAVRLLGSHGWKVD